jgi:hypothetical protein
MLEYLMQSDLAINSVNDLMTDADTGEAQARFVTRPSRVTVAIEADAVGVELEIFAGARTAVPRSTLDAGGTVGVFPNINEKAFSFFAASGEKLRFIMRETAGVATTDVMAAVSVDPIA